MSKRIITGACLLGIAGVAGLVASGFPRRVGLTRSEAALSLPGDLVFPQAPIVGDRATSVATPLEALWSETAALVDNYQNAWGRSLLLESEEDQYARVWRTVDGEEDWDASLAAVLLPGVDGRTTLHIRERYGIDDARTRGLRWQTALSVPFVFRRFRKQGRS